MKHGSLFSGIGGFDLAAEWMGWQNVFHCEWNPFGQKVLKYYWPNAIQYHDITKTDFTIHRGDIDLITGGFPCQPYSSAGKRLGKEDERHLWPEMLRAIKEIQPRWVVGENVYGLVNWSRGLVFHEVQADLEAQGYEVFPYVLPAAAVNAPHRRLRVFFVAYSAGNGCNKQGKKIDKRKKYKSCNWDKVRNIVITNGQKSNASNSESESSRRELQQQQKQREFGGCHSRKYSNNWKNFPSVSPICFADDGISNRLDSITFSKWRNESIKAAGNAIVPQVAFQIFKTIEKFLTIKP